MTRGATSLDAPGPAREAAPPQAPGGATAATASPGAEARTRRQRAERLVCRLLAVRAPATGTAPRREDEAGAQRLFNVSMALSGLRCLLSYVVLPVLTPALGAAARVGPILGVPIAAVALVFDVVALRRFWAAQHRWRWGVSAVYLAVMALVLALLVGDVAHLAG